MACGSGWTVSALSTTGSIRRPPSPRERCICRQGQHLIEVEYFDNREGAQIRVYWEKQGSFANWKGEYFANPRLEGEPALVRNDEDINFNWGTGAPSPQIPADNFTVRWTQSITFSEGAYRFKARADDGVRVWVDDRLIIDAWLPNVEQTFVGYVWLAQGTTLCASSISNSAAARLSGLA